MYGTILNNLFLLGLAHLLNPDSLFTKAKIIWIGAPYVSELFFADLYQRYFCPNILQAFWGLLGTDEQALKKNKRINRNLFILQKWITYYFIIDNVCNVKKLIN